jgi:hypothetical protein
MFCTASAMAHDEHEHGRGKSSPEKMWVDSLAKEQSLLLPLK